MRYENRTEGTQKKTCKNKKNKKSKKQKKIQLTTNTRTSYQSAP